jgi:hypothetical protein
MGIVAGVGLAGGVVGGLIGYNQSKALIPEHSDKGGYTAGNFAAVGVGALEGSGAAAIGAITMAGGALGDSAGTYLLGAAILGVVPGLVVGTVAGMIHEHNARD